MPRSRQVLFLCKIIVWILTFLTMTSLGLVSVKGSNPGVAVGAGYPTACCATPAMIVAAIPRFNICERYQYSTSTYLIFHWYTNAGTINQSSTPNVLYCIRLVTSRAATRDIQIGGKTVPAAHSKGGWTRIDAIIWCLSYIVIWSTNKNFLNKFLSKRLGDNLYCRYYKFFLSVFRVLKVGSVFYVRIMELVAMWKAGLCIIRWVGKLWHSQKSMKWELREALQIMPWK